MADRQNSPMTQSNRALTFQKVTIVGCFITPVLDHRNDSKDSLPRDVLLWRLLTKAARLWLISGNRRRWSMQFGYIFFHSTLGLHQRNTLVAFDFILLVALWSRALWLGSVYLLFVFCYGTLLGLMFENLQATKAPFFLFLFFFFFSPNVLVKLRLLLEPHQGQFMVLVALFNSENALSVSPNVLMPVKLAEPGVCLRTAQNGWPFLLEASKRARSLPRNSCR